MSQRMYYAKQAYGDVYKGAAAKRDWGIQQKDRFGRSTTPGLDKAFGNIGSFLDDKLDGASAVEDAQNEVEESHDRQNDSTKLMSQAELQQIKENLANTLGQFGGTGGAQARTGFQMGGGLLGNYLRNN